MKSMVKVLLLSVALGGAILGMGRTADASHTTLDVVAPGQLTVGDSVDIRAVLHSADDGHPVAGATLTFYMKASFGGVEREAVLGRAVTDKNGVALLPYQPRSEGKHLIRIQYSTPGANQPEEVTWSHSVAGTTQQLYRSTAGVQIPGLNAWLLMAVVAGVWTILLSVALRVIAIARAGAEAGVAPQPEAVRRARRQEAAPKAGGAGGR